VIAYAGAAIRVGSRSAYLLGRVLWGSEADRFLSGALQRDLGLGKALRLSRADGEGTVPAWASKRVVALPLDEMPLEKRRRKGSLESASRKLHDVVGELTGVALRSNEWLARGARCAVRGLFAFRCFFSS
jgi:hypothetical protein